MFKDYMWEGEAKLLAALVYSYRALKDEFYSEGSVRRPWQPSEVIVLMARKLMEKKVAFRELEFDAERMTWKARNFKYAANGSVPFSSVPDGEKRKANAILSAIMEWDEEVLKKIGEDEQVCSVLEAKGFERTEKPIEREVQKVQEGGFAMDMLDMDEAKLKEIKEAEAKAKDATGTTAMPQTLEEYKAEMEKEVATLKEQMKISSPKSRHKISLEIKRLQANVDRAEKDAAAAAAYQAGGDSGMPVDNQP